MLLRVLFFIFSLFFLTLAIADVSRPGTVEQVKDGIWDLKLTPSYYSTTNQIGATDLNLRANSGPHAVWLGYYHRGNEFEQTRTGYEFTSETDFGKVVPSIQLASHGFAGVSLNTEVGNQVFALLGFGRTNTKEYYNLNFDPNDSITYGLGTRLFNKSTLSIFAIKDNRLHTGQMVTHVVWRYQTSEQQRWIVDLSSKHGSPSEGEDSVSGKAVSATYNYQSFFVRLARDHKVNFTSEDQTRISLGLRF